MRQGQGPDSPWALGRLLKSAKVTVSVNVALVGHSYLKHSFQRSFYTNKPRLWGTEHFYFRISSSYPGPCCLCSLLSDS